MLQTAVSNLTCEYQNNPNKAINKPQLLKQIKQGAGVLTDDDRPVQNYINIGSIQNLMARVSEQRGKRLTADEVIPVEPEEGDV